MNLPKLLALGSSRSAARAACVALLATSLLPAQTKTDDFSPSTIELDLFGGAALFHKRPDPLATKLLNSMEFGTHVTENLWNHWSLEQSFSGSTLADLTLLPFPGAASSRRIDLEQRVWKLSSNPVFHFTPRGSRIRPFLTAGFTEAIFSATKDGKDYAASLTPVPASGFKTSFKPAFNYGGGIKVRFTDLIGLRMDVRGIWSGAPTWGLPGSSVPPGALYIPDTGSMHGMEATAGIVFHFGHRTSTPRAERVFSLSPIQAQPDPATVGDMVTFTTQLNDSAHASNIVYKWTIDGIAQSATGPELRTNTLAAGDHTITVTATDPKTGATATQTRTFTVRAAVAPITSLTLSSIRVNPATGCEGDTLRFSTTVTDPSNAQGVTYAWTADNNNQSATGPEFSTSSLSAGTHTIKVTATLQSATGSQTTSVTINPLAPLTITDSADRTQLKFKETARLSAQATETPCSGPLTFTWSTDIGSVQGNGSSATFDSSTMPFDPANVFKAESRTATITASVRDQRGRTATANPIKITVNKDPQTARLDDLVFGLNSSRVNNCAKRILIDELQALMNANPDVEVLLIGHADAAETAKGLDHQRVYNAAAVLSAATGVCASADVTRIKASYAGTDQTSDFRSGFCGTSTRQKSDERKADEIAADDAAAKNRRVEIWIVPKGGDMPAGAKDPQSAPVRIIKAKGCPK